METAKDSDNKPQNPPISSRFGIDSYQISSNPIHGIISSPRFWFIGTQFDAQSLERRFGAGYRALALSILPPFVKSMLINVLSELLGLFKLLIRHWMEHATWIDSPGRQIDFRLCSVLALLSPPSPTLPLMLLPPPLLPPPPFCQSRRQGPWRHRRFIYRSFRGIDQWRPPSRLQPIFYFLFFSFLFGQFHDGCYYIHRLARIIEK